MSKPFNILFKDKKYSFCYSFNDNTTFLDLIESFAFNYPELNICPCYGIQRYNNLSSYEDIDTKAKIKDNNSNFLYNQYQIELKSNNNICNCNDTFQRYYRKSKIEIINRLCDYKKAYYSLYSEKEKLENNNKQLIEENKQLNEKKRQTVEKNNQLIEENKQLNEKNKQTVEKNNQLIEEKRKGNDKLNKDYNFTEFYDIIININSIKDICKGWEIKMSENAKKNYQQFKEVKNLKIGVIGNANKGKSFLLSKISNHHLPSGTSIRTEGLSVKYLEFDSIQKGKKIVLLDSAGLETPVLKEEFNEVKIVKSILENDDKNKDDKDKKQNNYFKDKSREKLITELFLQHYIINYSDILIIVVGIMTYSEQKLLNKIKNELKMMEKNDHFKEKEKPNISLFVIHNLITYKSVNQVEDYIDEFLLKSATLNLEEAIILDKKENGTHYTEKFGQKTIYHLIYAHEGSEAGDFYNKYTLDFITSYFKTTAHLKPYDVIETVKDNFIELSNDILEKTEKPITKESFDKTNNDIIKLSEVKDIVLKKCLIDELGFSNLKANSFEPTFNYYKTDDGKILKIRIEAPGNCELNTKRYPEDKYNVIIIQGNKLKDKMTEEEEKIQKSNREYGDFKLDIRLEFDYFRFKTKKPKIEQIDGVFRLEYEAEDEEEEGSFKPKEIK